MFKIIMFGGEVMIELHNDKILGSMKGYKAVVDAGCFKITTFSDELLKK